MTRLLQIEIIQTLEKAGVSQGVSRPGEGVVADKQLISDIRKFQSSTPPEPAAEIEFAARILSDNGRIVEAKQFRASVPVSAMNAPLAAAALDQAFGTCAAELVNWVATVI